MLCHPRSSISKFLIGKLAVGWRQPIASFVALRRHVAHIR
jgi:hypothetical protein